MAAPKSRQSLAVPAGSWARGGYWAATNLTPNDFNNASDLFIYETVPMLTSRLGPVVGEPDGESSAPVVTADGTMVAFQSSASNLVPDDTNQAVDAFVYDRASDVLERVSVSRTGAQASGSSTSPAISADGRFLTFSSDASDVVPVDANSSRDVFQIDRGEPSAPPAVVLIEPSEGERLFDVQSLAAAVAGELSPTRVEFLVDGTITASDSEAPYEVSWDTSGVEDGDREILARAVAPDDSVFESAAVTVTVVNTAACDEKLYLDFQAATISVDDYVRWGMQCAFAPGLLAERYGSTTEVHDRLPAYFRVYEYWDQVSQATRDEVRAFFDAFNSGAYLEPVANRARSGGSRSAESGPLAHESCDAEYKWCEHYADERWRFGYATEDYDGVPRDDADSNGIRDDIEVLTASLNHAWDTYTELGFLEPPTPVHVVLRKYCPTIGAEPAPVVCAFDGNSVTPPPGAPPDATGSADIYLDYPHVDRTANPMHELFHAFEYVYFNESVWDWKQLGTAMWMEATAEWALHKASEGYLPIDSPHGDDYADDLPEFLADPNVSLDYASEWWWYWNDHEYGAFILPEYLEALIVQASPPPPPEHANRPDYWGEEFIRQTWAKIAEASGLGGLEAVNEVLVQNWESSLGERLPGFWRTAYRMSTIADPSGSVGTAFLPDDPVAVWRGLLDNEAYSTNPLNEPFTNPYAEARAERQVFPLEDNRVAAGLIDPLWPGGAAFVEFVHRGATELTIDVRNGIYLGSDPVPYGENIRLSVYSFAAYPDQLCQAPTVDVPLQATGVASLTIPLTDNCAFTTLFISHTDPLQLDPLSFYQNQVTFEAQCSGCVPDGATLVGTTSRYVALHGSSFDSDLLVPEHEPGDQMFVFAIGVNNGTASWSSYPLRFVDGYWIEDTTGSVWTTDDSSGFVHGLSEADTHVRVWHRTASADEPASYKWRFTSSNGDVHYWFVVIRDRAPAAYYDVSSGMYFQGSRITGDNPAPIPADPDNAGRFAFAVFLTANYALPFTNVSDPDGWIPILVGDHALYFTSRYDGKITEREINSTNCNHDGVRFIGLSGVP